MASEFVRLDRTFLPIESDATIDFEDVQSQLVWEIKKGVPWSEIFKNWRTVVLAEPGAGKTAELEAANRQLCKQGKLSFFCRVETLADFGISGSIDPPFSKTFQSWLSGEKEAWFLLDSVDEARLKDISMFEKALRRFSLEISDAQDRAHIILSCRVSDWQATADKTLLNRLLPKSNDDDRGVTDDSNIQKVSDLLPTPEENAPKSIENRYVRNLEKPLKKSGADIYQLVPLNWQQITRFVEAMKIEDSTAFIYAVEKENLKSFAERPQDLQDLITYWRRKGQFGRYEEMVEFSISQKLEEIKPAHDKVRPLSCDQARIGAEHLAAAVTLTKRTAILLPDTSIAVDLRVVSIQPKTTLPTWTGEQINTLLSRAIFDEALYGTVQFHHRLVREYLTACWLRRLLDKKGIARQAVEDLIFAEQYGCEVVIPSMRPVAAWLALWDEQICNRLRDHFPEILLTYGDASSLRVDVRHKLLKNFAEQYEQRKRVGLYIETAAIRRLASPELADAIILMLKEYTSHSEICQVLLRLVIFGEMRSAVSAVLPLALDKRLDEEVRAYAVEAVVTIGSDSEKKTLLKNLSNASIETLHSKMVNELIGLYPDFLTVSSLAILLKGVEVSSQFSTHMLRENLKNLITEEYDLDKIKCLLDELFCLLESKPLIHKRKYRISQKYEWLEPYAIQCANKFVAARDPYALEPIVMHLFYRYINRIGHHRQDSHQPNDLLALAKQWPNFRYKLFWYFVKMVRFEQNCQGIQRKQWQYIGCQIYRFWVPTEEDTENLLNTITTAEMLDDRHIALNGLWKIYLDTDRSPAFKARIESAVHGQPELYERLQNLLSPRIALSDEEKEDLAYEKQLQKEEEARSKEKEEVQQRWRDLLPKSLSALRNVEGAKEGIVQNGIWYLYNQIEEEQSRARLGKPDWRCLVPMFGKAVSEAYRDGCMKYWRVHNPFFVEDWRTSSSIPISRIIGLTGLAIESTDNPSWIEHLTPTEATNAARYAVVELNGFPDWFFALRAAFPAQIDSVIEKIIRLEMEGNSDKYSSGVLYRLQYARKDLKRRFQTCIIQCLEKNKLEQLNRLEYALAIALIEVEDFSLRQRLVRMIAFQFSEATININKIRLLSAMMHIDAEEGFLLLTNFVEKQSDHKQKVQTVEQFCSSLTDDIHHGVPRFRVDSPDYNRVEFLRKLIPFLYEYINPTDDLSHTGVYSPGLRDAAQENRSWLVSIVAETPGEETYTALNSFAQLLGEGRQQSYLIQRAEERAALDSEHELWEEKDIIEFQERIDNAQQPTQPQDSISQPRRKILILSANPKNSARLRLDEEVRNIQEGLQRARHRDDFEIAQRWAVRPRDLQRAMLEEAPQIIHFSGHAKQKAGLYLENDIGDAQLVTGDALSQMFKLFSQDCEVECVILNGCYSLDQAEAIARHVPYVVGMQASIKDAAAIDFSIGFYDALGNGKSVKFAFEAGKVLIGLNSTGDISVPVLIPNRA